MDLLQVAGLGFLAGVVGTGLGGLIGALTYNRLRLPLGAMLGFSAGVMLAVVFHELIPEAIEDGGMTYAIVGLFAGVLLMLLLDRMLPHEHIGMSADQIFVRTGLLLGLGIALHNFPEGVAIGASYAHTPALGYSVALVLALHNLPEGLAMAIPLCAGGICWLRVTAYTLLAGVPMGIGAILGGWIGSVSPTFLGIGLGFAAGAMLYIVAHELLPGARTSTKGNGSVIGVLLGVIVAMLLI